MLLPISESAYAYGKAVDTNNVLVAIGGGFVADLSIADAIKFY